MQDTSGLPESGLNLYFCVLATFEYKAMSTTSLRLQDIRQEYMKAELSEEAARPDAIEQFEDWFRQALHAGIAEPTAMSLSTMDADGRLSARIVLLKDFDAEGFVFFTNYQSRKAAAVISHPQVALLFFWPELERQIRIEGRAEKVAEAVSDAYFNSRPPGSRIGAWASPQSQVIPARSVLEENVRKLEKTFQNKPVPRPGHWGGFRVQPERIEFWQGRPSRLHDRLLYTRVAEKWQIQRLAP